MSKLPSFQFYPADWRKDPDLARCSKSEKGMWIDMLCLMHECEDRGVLSSGGAPWQDREIAAAVGGDTTENLTLLHGLLTKGVARRGKSGAVFSQRMVRDEQIRKKRRECGILGGNPVLVNQNTTTRDNQNTRSSFSSSSSSSKQKTTDAAKTGRADPPRGENYEIRTPLQEVVAAYKVCSGNALDDRVWDQVYYARCSASARQLLTLFGGDSGKCIDCIDQVSTAFKKIGKSWTMETIVKHAADWKNGRLFK